MTTTKNMTTLRDWTPKKAHRFAVSRLEKIQHLLNEISYTYDGIYQPVTFECELAIENGLKDIRTAIDEALQLEAQL